MRIQSGLALTLVMLVLSVGSAASHDGHDHGPEPAPAPTSVAPRGEAASDVLELVAIAQGRELVLYVDRFATNEPIDAATVEVETPDGPAPATGTNGIYRLNGPWLERPGHVDLIVTVTVDGNAEVLPVSFDIPAPAATAVHSPEGWLSALGERVQALARGSVLPAGVIGFLVGCIAMGLALRRRSTAAAIALLMVLSNSSGWAHDGHDHTPPPTSPGIETAARQSDGTVFVPKPIQRVFGLRTVRLEAGSFQRSIELPGRIIPDPNASGYVQALVGGRLSSPPGGFPRLGTRVKQGDLVGYVTAPLQAIDVSDMRQRQGELDQQIAIVEQRIARLERLLPSGAVARVQYDESKLELEGLRERRVALDKVRREPETLIAPVNGIVADGTPVAGQVVAANAIVFHIVDPAKLWVEALSFQAPSENRDATMLTADGRTRAIEFRGAGLAGRNQTVPLHFAIETDASGLRLGQFVTVLTSNGEPTRGIAVPRTAVVRASNGQELVYEHVSAERFAPRPVRTAPLDGERVLIEAGVEPGQRVVTQGAELLDHVR